jgi:hydrogenase expression/formation protein HypE
VPDEKADQRAVQLGKLDADLLTGAVLGHLGADDPDVLVKPQPGVDVGVMRVAPGVVMAVTTDPVFVMPELGWERACWFAVHILASDAATSGLPLRAMTVDLNLPPDLSDTDLAALWRAYAGACADLGITVVTGHTARYAGCAWPMVGGATCVAIGAEDAYVTPTMARPGDRVLVTKGAAIEATALFAAAFPDRLRAEVGEALYRDAHDLLGEMTVVPEARAAAAYGLRDAGVTAMHDATEGGVLGGLLEIAAAAGTGIRVDLAAIPVRPEVEAVCRAAGMDPYTSISEGTLLATVRPEHAAGVLAAFAAAGVTAAEVGEIVPAERGRVVVEDGRESSLVAPPADPFWAAFARWAGGNGA